MTEARCENWQESWTPASFLIAMPEGPEVVQGYEYRGLGLHIPTKVKRSGKMVPRWSLTHLGTGHRIAEITGLAAKAFPVATEVADAGDWTFDGLKGWANQFPDALEKTLAILGKYRFAHITGDRGGETREDVARAIALHREHQPAPARQDGGK